MIDLNELRRLTQGATPGPWHATKSVETNSWAVWSDTTRLMELRPTKTVDMYRVSNTATFIAAASPAAISELIDRLEAAERNLNCCRGERMEAAALFLSVKTRLTDERDALRAAVRHEADCVEAAKAEVEALRAKLEAMEKQEPVACMGRGPRDGRIEFSVHKPSPSAMRDFNVIPLYTLPGAKGEGE